MNRAFEKFSDTPSPYRELSVLSAQPVGVWRTYQSYDDYLACIKLPVRDPNPGAGASTCHGVLLSACIIARNEEQNLKLCLDSIRALVDEVIVVDTGSTDRTREIAQEYGARVFDLPWSEDFSAPRNEASRHAQGEWILSIDADETALPYCRGSLHQLLGDDNIGGYYLLFRRRAALTPNWQMRLYRNHSGLRHESRIHEAITTGQVRAVTGRGVGRCRLLLEHSGYEGDLIHKHARNLPILLQAIDPDPNHPDKGFLWGHLAEIYNAQRDYTAAELAWQRGAEVLRPLSRLHPAHCSVHLGRLTYLVSRKRDVEPFLQEVERLYPGNLQATWIRGFRLLDLGRYRQAIECFEHLLDRGKKQNFGHWVGYDRRLFDELPYRSLSACHARLKDWATSAHYQQLADESARCKLNSGP